MKTSALNQFPGALAKVVHGLVNSEMAVANASGRAVAALVTNESARTLDTGAPSLVVALFKAPSLVLVVAAWMLSFSEPAAALLPGGEQRE
jgi:molybdopterin-binding protein